MWRSTRHGQQMGRPASPAWELARSPIDDLVATFFPADCRVCKGPLRRAGRVPVCEPCLAALTPQPARPGTLCGICGEALGFESERFAASHAARVAPAGSPAGLHQDQLLCTPCRRRPPAFLRAAAFGLYAEELRALLHLFKYSGVRSLAAPLGDRLAEAIAQLIPALDPATETLLVAVPLFRGKARERGFNQAELLSAQAIRSLRRSHPALRLRPAHAALTRSKSTASQFGLNPRQRRQNLRDAFAVPEPTLIAGRDLILVDDIFTTGATARTCALALSQAGARTVFVATLARAQPVLTTTWAAWDGTLDPVSRSRFGQGDHYYPHDPQRRADRNAFGQDA